MKTLLPFLWILACFKLSWQQPVLAAGTQVTFTNQPADGFGNAAEPKDVTQPEADTLFIFHKRQKNKSLEKLIEKNGQNNFAPILFQTTSLAEFNEMNRELQQAGFSYSAKHTVCPNVYALYQRGNLCIRPHIKKEAEQTLYCFLIEKKQLPTGNTILHAEDLFQLQSHEYLTAVFGSNNVQKDVFYFTENDIAPCSILFPKTAMQVIFVWADKDYNSNISLLILGRNTGATAFENFYRPVQWGKWRSLQGVYPGMPLKELEQLNGNNLNLYGWETETPGFVHRDSKGKIDFRKIGIQLDCLDCNEDRFYSDTPLLNSATLLQHNRQVYVSTVILSPE